MGWPFLTSGYTYLSPAGRWTSSSWPPPIFDLGVFLCVLGAVMLALSLAGAG
jgi:hypothetical protein